MKHLGDIMNINGAEIELTDLVTGGSPCQDLSVAGLRKGLQGERSSLFLEQIRVIKEMREHDKRMGTDRFVRRPRFMVWENVPGALSSSAKGMPKGEDFRCVLEETARIADPDAVIPRPTNGKWAKAGSIVGDGYSIAWRVVDAQFFGTPQRRRRICLVADFNGYSAAEILFDPQYIGETEMREQDDSVRSPGDGDRPQVQSVEPCVQRNTEEGEQAWEGTPGDSEDRT